MKVAKASVSVRLWMNGEADNGLGTIARGNLACIHVALYRLWYGSGIRKAFMRKENVHVKDLLLAIRIAESPVREARVTVDETAPKTNPRHPPFGMGGTRRREVERKLHAEWSLFAPRKDS